MTALPQRSVGPLDRVSFVRWVGVLGDVDSPVHYDRVAAQEHGYHDVLAPGMQLAAMLADHATSQFGVEHVRSCRWRFVESVWPGDVVTLRGTAESQADGTIAVELECVRGEDDVAVRCWMTFAASGAPQPAGERDRVGGDGQA